MFCFLLCTRVVTKNGTNFDFLSLPTAFFHTTWCELFTITFLNTVTITTTKRLISIMKFFRERCQIMATPEYFALFVFLIYFTSHKQIIRKNKQINISFPSWTLIQPYFNNHCRHLIKHNVEPLRWQMLSKFYNYLTIIIISRKNFITYHVVICN